MPAEKAQARYAIKGMRPGESYVTPFGSIDTDPIDGGAYLKPDQKKYFDEIYGTEKRADVPPQAEPEPINERAAARMAENAAVAASAAEQESRLADAQAVIAAGRAASAAQ